MKALFGGSFNPVHNGHLILARDVVEDFGFEKLFFVPAKVQPLKGKLLIPPEVRLSALRAAVSLYPRFDVWDFELKSEGVSYTYRTLEHFHRLYGERPAFVLGADSFASLPRWKEPQRVLELARLVVMARPGYSPDFEEVFRQLGLCPKFIIVEKEGVELPQEWDVALYRGRLLDISATEIRRRLLEGDSISYFVPEQVEKILRRWRDGLQQNV